MLTFALALSLTAGVAADTGAAARTQGTPVVVVHRQPALPIVALRLSILADDPAGYAGAGHLFQHLALRSLEDQVGRVGGRVQAIRSSEAVVYTVVGASAELPYLAAALRTALRPPTAGTAEVLVALNQLAEERDGEVEQADAYVRAALRAKVFPNQLPAAGTAASAARLEIAKLGELWGEMYRPERVNIVAVGDVEHGAVRRAFAGLPAASGDRLAEAPQDSAVLVSALRPEASRGWIGRAFLAPEMDPAAISVTGRMLRDMLRRRLTTSSVEVEHWWTREGHALAVVVAAPPTAVPAARRAVAGAVAALDAGLDPEEVRRARQRVRRDMLFYSRTPERMAEVLGEFSDRGDSPGAAQRFFAAIEAVEVDAVRAVLEALREQTAASVEVAAQVFKKTP